MFAVGYAVRTGLQSDRLIPRSEVLPPDAGDRLFNCFYDCLECFRLVHRQIGHYLAVDGNSLGVDFADELLIGHPVCANRGVDTRYPQRTERPLFDLAVCIGILQTLFDRVFGNGPYISP